MLNSQISVSSLPNTMDENKKWPKVFFFLSQTVTAKKINSHITEHIK
jgi:hypothetical protein